jgi:hypothetical protein
MSAKDAESGLAVVDATEAENVTSDVSSFELGTNDPVFVTAIKDDQNEMARVVLELTDVAENTNTCLPLLLLVTDLKPGSDPNSVNCVNDNEIITVALLTTETFDATTVDHTTVTLEGAVETHTEKKSGKPTRHEEDVDGDGDLDLVFHFRLGDTNLTCGSAGATLIGETHDGILVLGTDSVRMIDKGSGQP